MSNVRTCARTIYFSSVAKQRILFTDRTRENEKQAFNQTEIHSSPSGAVLFDEKLARKNS